ncbi:hypothetical protein Tco_1436560, partial [Tanacetum coccineum]
MKMLASHIKHPLLAPRNRMALSKHGTVLLWKLHEPYSVISLGRSCCDSLLRTKPILNPEDLGKLKPKVDVGIFVGYAPAKKAYRIYNKRTRLIIETIHVTFDELTVMASKQFGSGPEPQLLTPGTLSSGLVPNPPSPTPIASPVPEVVTPVLVDSTGTPSSTSVDQDAPSLSTSQTPQETQSLVIPSVVEEKYHDIEDAYLDNDPFFG